MITINIIMNLNNFHPVIWFLLLKCRQPNNKRSKSYPIVNVFLYFFAYIQRNNTKGSLVLSHILKATTKTICAVLVFCVPCLETFSPFFRVCEQKWKGQLDRDGICYSICVLYPLIVLSEWSFFYHWTKKRMEKENKKTTE